MTSLVLVLYIAISAVLLLYAANAYYMIVVSLQTRASLLQRNAKNYQLGLDLLTHEETWPLVTTQIPLYNEIRVAERIIKAVAAIDYPTGSHEIQVLDDSTDETCALVEEVVKQLQVQGVAITILRRVNRIGFKAGALADGMSCCQGTLIAIFDADFMPPPDFLRRTVPHLIARKEAGWVQARWGHVNENSTLLTKAQGIGIDGHFAVEQGARAGMENLFMNFNGTAGVWRREAIIDAGGWTADTLTEDLDLSYRAQLRGWKGIYLPDLVVLGELPADTTAFKNQQFRWAKGSIQTAFKLAPPLFRSPLSLHCKIQGWVHLTHYGIHPLILLLALLSMPLAWLLPVGWHGWGWVNFIVAGISFAPSAFYATGQCLLHKNWKLRLFRLPLLILAGIGLTLTTSLAVLEAFLGKESPFIRTPKQGTSPCGCYQVETCIPSLELAVGILCFGMFVLAALNGRALASQFLLLCGAGFLFFALSSSLSRLLMRRSLMHSSEKKALGINHPETPFHRYTEDPFDSII